MGVNYNKRRWGILGIAFGGAGTIIATGGLGAIPIAVAALGAGIIGINKLNKDEEKEPEDNERKMNSIVRRIPYESSLYESNFLETIRRPDSYSYPIISAESPETSIARKKPKLASKTLIDLAYLTSHQHNLSEICETMRSTNTTHARVKLKGSSRYKFKGKIDLY